MHQLLVFLAACAGGAINSVAGGGTLLTVPTLIWLGVPALNANATSTVALWPGSLSGAWGFRREMRQADRRVYSLVVPSLIGGLTGAVLLTRTPPGVFERLIPGLILFATLLFMVQGTLRAPFVSHSPRASHSPGPKVREGKERPASRRRVGERSPETG